MDLSAAYRAYLRRCAARDRASEASKRMNSSPTHDQLPQEEAQDLNEVRDIALAQNPFDTLRMLYKCPAYALLTVSCFLGAKDVAEGRSLSDLGQFWGAVIFALRFCGAVFSVVTVTNWRDSYWRTNLLTQWCMLIGTATAALYFSLPAPPVTSSILDSLGLIQLQPATGKLILAVIGALVFEFVAILWLVRRRDAERIHRLKQFGQVIGLFSALATTLFVAFNWGHL